MIFLIETPEWEEDAPIEGAYKQPIMRRDWRTIGKLSHAEGMHWYKGWFWSGENHREEAGMIVCDVKTPINKWFIEVNTIEDLLALNLKHGSLKIRPPHKEYFGTFPIIDLFD